MMKRKAFGFFLLVVVMLTLAACSTATQPATTEPDVEQTAEPTAEQVTEPATGTAEEVTLTLGSWRVDDARQWETILAAFHEQYPNITIKYDPTNPPDYNAALRTQLETGIAPDLMVTRSYATSRQLFEDGYLEPLTDLAGIDENYTPESLAPWSTEDGVPYSVPLQAVSHGIYYNVDVFNELGLEVPATWEDLMAAAQTIQDAGYTPFANASKDSWTIAEIVFMNLLPNYIGGYEGRLEYQEGKRCFNDENMVAAFQAIKDIAPYLPEGQEALVYYDSQQLFLQGKAIMWFGGSWDIPLFESEEPEFEWSVFAVPPPEGKPGYVTFHLDAGMGVNPASANKETAKLFLEWLQTSEFRDLFANELPGFYPVSTNSTAVSNEHAAAFLALSEGRGTDVRFVWEKLLDGAPSGYDLVQNGAIAVIMGEKTPQEAADDLQNGLAQWYEPAKTCGK